MIIRCLTEGNSVRATCRLTGAAKGTVLKLVVEFGEFAERFQDETLIELPCKRIELDEIWAFCGCKEKAKAKAKLPQQGDVWTWTSICSDTKLCPSWLVGDRGYNSAVTLVEDLESRLANRVQISTDGLKAYVHAIKGVFGEEVDHGRLIKVYGQDTQGRDIVLRCAKIMATGSMPEDEINTSFVERQNLTMRMNMRRFTRLTNGFSKKVENHAAMIAIHFLNYNFTRKHQTLKTSPAVAAGVVNEMMKMEEMVERFDHYRSENFPVNRPLRYNKQRKKTVYEPQTPKTPWHLDPTSPESQARYEEIMKDLGL